MDELQAQDEFHDQEAQRPSLGYLNDSRRLDWLEKTQTSIGYNVENSSWGVDYEAPYGSTIREAVDFAMAEDAAESPHEITRERMIAELTADLSPRESGLIRRVEELKTELLCLIESIEAGWADKASATRARKLLERNPQPEAVEL